MHCWKSEGVVNRIQSENQEPAWVNIGLINQLSGTKIVEGLSFEM